MAFFLKSTREMAALLDVWSSLSKGKLKILLYFFGNHVY
jgi:hypothetical protein